MADVDTNNIISINRGDTFYVPLFINAGSDLKPIRYKITDKDKIYLGVMEPNQPFEDAIIKKAYTLDSVNKHGDVVICLDHEDTRCLMPGKYFYQIKGTIYNQKLEKYEVVTIIQKTEFWIEE